MRLVDQSVMHDPANGKYGNCQSACLATILCVDIDSVPHKNEDINGEEQDKMFNEWLASFGLMILHMDIQPDWFEWQRKYVGAGDIYHFIFGMTERGTYHSVVGKNGAVFHDPHPSKTGLLPQSETNSWRFVFLLRTTKPRSVER